MLTVQTASLTTAAAVRAQVEAVLAHANRGMKVCGALTVRERPQPELLPTGIRTLDAALHGGVPRGALSEFCGSPSSGRTSLMLAWMAQLTQRGECCALVDVSDAFDPLSAQAAGVVMERLLWVRCGSSRQLPASRQAIGCRSSVVGREISRQPSVVSKSGQLRLKTEDCELNTQASSASPLRGEEESWHAAATSWKKQQYARLEQALKVTDMLLQSGGF